MVLIIQTKKKQTLISNKYIIIVLLFMVICSKLCYSQSCDSLEHIIEKVEYSHTASVINEETQDINYLINLTLFRQAFIGEYVSTIFYKILLSKQKNFFLSDIYNLEKSLKAI